MADASPAREVAPTGTPVAITKALSRGGRAAARDAALARSRLLQERRNERVWLDMLRNWKRWKGSRQLVLRCRQGVPSGVRGLVWAKLLDVEGLDAEQPGLYEKCLAEPNESAARAIELDIGRTFPASSLFARKGGTGQVALQRVLTAYASLDEEVGYCQGMAFVAAVLLSFAAERQAFLMLVRLFRYRPWRLRTLFLPGMRGVKALLGALQLLLMRQRPSLAEHLRAEGVDPAMVFTPWLMSVFAHGVPFEVTVRVWDCMLAEGFKAVVRVALAVVLRARLMLEGKRFEQVMLAVRALTDVTFEEPDALRPPITRQDEGAAEDDETASSSSASSSSASSSSASGAASTSSCERTVAEQCADVLDPDALITAAFAMRLKRKDIVAAVATAAGEADLELPG